MLNLALAYLKEKYELSIAILESAQALDPAIEVYTHLATAYKVKGSLRAVALKKRSIPLEE